MKFAIAIPQFYADGEFDPEAFRAYFARAEELGFDSAWTQESMLGAAPQFGPIEAMTYAAACTERMRLGCVVFVSTLHSPVHLAKSLSSLDHLSGGRLDVGVGLGGNPRVYPAFGISAERRAARFTESIRVMKQLWTEPRVTFRGDFWQLDSASMEPKPLQKPHPPIWFGAHHPDALRRAIELGDAFMGAGSLATSGFADEVKLLRGMLEDAGRDPAGFPVGKRVYIAVDRDRARAGQRLAEWFGAFYGRPEMAEQVSVWGDTQACVDGLAAVVAAGARVLLLNPVFDDAEHLERFAADIVPKLSA